MKGDITMLEEYRLDKIYPGKIYRDVAWQNLHKNKDTPGRTKEMCGTHHGRDIEYHGWKTITGITGCGWEEIKNIIIHPKKTVGTVIQDRNGKGIGRCLETCKGDGILKVSPKITKNKMIRSVSGIHMRSGILGISQGGYGVKNSPGTNLGIK